MQVSKKSFRKFIEHCAAYRREEEKRGVKFGLIYAIKPTQNEADYQGKPVKVTIPE